MSTARAWLLADVPSSRVHARCQRVYLGWLAFRGNPIAVAGLGIVVGLVVCAALAPWLTGSGGVAPELGNRLRPPSLTHWLRTDELGRDIYDRIVWGTRITLYIVGLVSVIVVPIGLVIGVVAGYVGGWVDNVLMRLTDIVLAFPRLILALAFDGIDLLRADERTMRTIRGGRISMIMQDPKFSLNPVISVGEQIVEAFRVHANASRREARERALEMLEAVRIRNPRHVFDAYPHEVSGGMGQRVMIAMMMIPEPDLIIADEPTSALDVTVQRQVLAVLDDMVSRRGTSLIFISHDLSLVASFCDRVLVMYAGRVMETMAASELHAARHPYTRGLLSCLPRVDGDGADLPVLERDPQWAR